MDPHGTSNLVTHLINAGALLLFLPLLVVAVLLSRPAARRLRTSRLLAGLSLVSIVGVLAVTLRPGDLLMLSSDVGAVLTCAGCDRFGWLTDAELWSGVAQVGPGWLLNVALFVPAGVFLTLATRRPWHVLVGLVGLSALIEVIQDLTFLGSPDPADLVANSLGAAIGVGVGAGALALSPQLRGPDGDGAPSRRALVVGLGFMVALGGLGWLGVQAGADARREALKDQLRTAFDGTSSAVIESKLATDDGFSELLHAVDTFPGYFGRVGETDEFEGRYTVQFVGAYRCTYVRWTTVGFTLRDGSGDECTVFRERPPSE